MDLSFQLLQKESFLYIDYYQFMFTCLKTKRKPFRMLQYNSDSDCQTFIVFSEAQNGQVVTRHFRLEYEIVDNPAGNGE